jgi:hypothetical protein
MHLNTNSPFLFTFMADFGALAYELSLGYDGLLHGNSDKEEEKDFHHRCSVVKILFFFALYFSRSPKRAEPSRI